MAVSVTLLQAEPSLGRLNEAQPISDEQANEQGYRFVRTYEDAVTFGLA